jgi:hypothetical protein
MSEERRDIKYIRELLWPEFLVQFIADNAEYPEERPLGARAEWHGLHRKVGKLKAPLWDGKEWTGREPVRRMLQEIIGHAFLAIASLDYEHDGHKDEFKGILPDKAADGPPMFTSEDAVDLVEKWYTTQRAARASGKPTGGRTIEP